jgi:50S ribosomal subunit-associated GTPase HflX
LALEEWIANFHDTAGTDSLVFVLANKHDLLADGEVAVDLNDAQRWAENNGYEFRFTSARTGFGLDSLLRDLAKRLNTRPLACSVFAGPEEPPALSASNCLC